MGGGEEGAGGGDFRVRALAFENHCCGLRVDV